MARWYDKTFPTAKDNFEKSKDEFLTKNFWTMRFLFILHIVSFLSIIYLWGKYVN